jgi:hypothetical protein
VKKQDVWRTLKETIYCILRGGKPNNGMRQRMEISKDNQEMEKEGKEETQNLEVSGEKYDKEERNEKALSLKVSEDNEEMKKDENEDRQSLAVSVEKQNKEEENEEALSLRLSEGNGEKRNTKTNRH